MESFMEAGSVYGNFFKAWGSPTKKQTINDSSTNNKTLLNDIHIYKLYANCDNKKKLLYTMTKLRSMHITLTNTLGGLQRQRWMEGTKWERTKIDCGSCWRSRRLGGWCRFSFYIQD